MLEYGDSVRASPPLGDIVAAVGGQIVCSPGPIEAIIDTGDFSLLGSLGLDRNGDGEFSADEELLGTEPTGGLYLVDAEGREYRSLQPEEVTVEEAGPVRGVVKVRGHHTSEDGEQLFRNAIDVLKRLGKENGKAMMLVMGEPEFRDDRRWKAAMGAREEMAAAGVAIYPNIERAARSMGRYVSYLAERQALE